MSYVYSATVPVPETLTGSWGTVTTTALVTAASPKAAAEVLGVPASEVTRVTEADSHDRNAAEQFPGRVVYCHPERANEWRVLNVAVDL